MTESASKSPISFGTDGWRAIMAREFTFDNVALVAQAIADFLQEKGIGERGLVVGWDARFLSEHFGALVADVMSANGIPVFLPERDTPTPVIAYNVRHHNAAGAVMITASHNPPEYNGIKFIPEYCHPALPEETNAIMAHVRRIEQDRSVVKSNRLDSLIQLIDPKPPYLEHLRNLLDLKSIGEAKLRVWYDPLYATGRGYLDEILRDAGAEVHVIHGERNPLFGNSLPDPNASNLAELSRLVVDTQSSLGLSTDGDADRFGIVDTSGAWLSPNQILVLVFLHWLRTRYPKGSVVRTAPTTHQVDALAQHFSFEVIETPVGFKWVGNALNTTDAIVGGEESGGLSVKGHIPEKDGILAGLIVAEQMATTGKTPLETLHEIDELVGHYETDRIDVHLDNARKNSLMQQLKSQPPASLDGQKVVRSSQVDGVQLVLENGAWTLIRPSGTEPLVRCYLEAHSAAEIESLKAAVQKLVGSEHV
jgi:alpha-D-glucose phosphate-specific phosphoglucomutase